MTKDEILRESFLYLKSVSKQYRSGVPFSLLESARKNEIENSSTASQKEESRIVFIYAKEESGARKIKPDHVSLFEAAIVKGLSLELAHQEIIALPSLTDGEALEVESKLSKMCSENPPSFIVFLGERLSKYFSLLQSEKNVVFHEKFDFEGVPAMITNSLIDVLSDPKIKRDFWRDLQVIKAAI